MNVYFNDSDYYDLKRRDARLYITLHAVHEGSSIDGSELNLILDTGAYITVISRGSAIKFRYDKLPKKSTHLCGFSGKIPADFVIIPSLKILGKTHTNIPVLIPHDESYFDEETQKEKLFPEVLGLNVLEYYNYFIDTEHDRIYLHDNSNPRFYNEALKSGQSFGLSIEPDAKI